MSLVILLDTGPLGLITNPNASQETDVGHLSRFVDAREWRKIQ